MQAIPSSKLKIFAHPAFDNIRESTLESYAQKALPDGTPAEREEYKRYWREQIWRERGEAPKGEAPKTRKTAAEWLEECKVHCKTRSHERQAELMGIERSVYYDLKAGKRVSAATRIKAANYITAKYLLCTASDLMHNITITD